MQSVEKIFFLQSTLLFEYKKNRCKVLKKYFVALYTAACEQKAIDLKLCKVSKKNSTQHFQFFIDHSYEVPKKPNFFLYGASHTRWKSAKCWKNIFFCILHYCLWTKSDQHKSVESVEKIFFLQSTLLFEYKKNRCKVLKKYFVALYTAACEQKAIDLKLCKVSKKNSTQHFQFFIDHSYEVPKKPNFFLYGASHTRWKSAKCWKNIFFAFYTTVCEQKVININPCKVLKNIFFAVYTAVWVQKKTMQSIEKIFCCTLHCCLRTKSNRSKTMQSVEKNFYTTFSIFHRPFVRSPEKTEFFFVWSFPHTLKKCKVLKKYFFCILHYCLWTKSDQHKSVQSVKKYFFCSLHCCLSTKKNDAKYWKNILLHSTLLPANKKQSI
jgi:YHS domain-containing protein